MLDDDHLTFHSPEQATKALLKEGKRIEAILAMQKAIAGARYDVEQVMQIIIEHGQRVTEATGGVVEIVDGEDMVYKATSGSAQAHIGLRLKREGSLSGLCVSENRVLLCEDTETDPRVDRETCRIVGVRSMVVVPLLQEEKTIGVLKVLSPKPNQFTQWDVTTLELMAGTMAAVLSDASSLRSLRESEERLRLLMDHLPLMIWVADEKAHLKFVNRYWAEFTGCPLERAYETSTGEFFHPEEREALLELFAEKAAAHHPYHTEYRRRYHDGQYRWMQATAVPQFRPDGTFAGYVGFSLDINEQKMLQGQLLESQKLESLGQLAGGIAHDFNNLLTAILGYTEIATESLAENAPQRALLNHVSAAGQRATDLTRQLLMYARRQMVEFREVEVGQVIQNLIPILKKTIGEQYDLATNLTLEDCYAYTNAGQIEQVLMNLMVNARDAMPLGGRLLLETACVTLDENYVATHFNVTPGEYVMFAVSDTGMGMTQEMLSHIFEPFFTTKEIGKGTGLGLATCYGIIKQSKGNLWVYSEVGQGTTFKIYLPRIQKVSHRLTPETKAPLPSGEETLLLVDDEEMVRDIAARILEKQGYRVLQARNGADALQIQSEYDGDVHLLITDVVMPLMGGRELEERIHRLRPTLKTLYMSGYTQNVIVQEGVLREGVVLLVKPFAASDLLEKVREALGEKSLHRDELAAD